MSAQPGSPPSSPLSPTRPSAAAAAAHPSAMRARMSAVAEFFGRRLFANAVVNERLVEKIRELSERGTVIYVLRSRSFVDYFMVNYVLRREGLLLPVFANGVSSAALAPLPELLRTLRDALARKLGRGPAPVTDHDLCARAVAAGQPVLIFMRGPRGHGGLAAAEETPVGRVGADYLREILAGARDSQRERFIVPLAPFRGHTFRRREAGVSALVYNVHETPSEWRKLLTYWFYRNNLFLTVGTEVRVADFLRRYGNDGEDRLVRRLTRAIQIFLHREERVVMGPAILPRKRVKALILEDDETRAFLAELAVEKGVEEAKLRKQAEGMFDEMAAEFNGAVFAVVAWLFKKIWNRMFQGLEPIGFEKVIEKVKNHPIVLVPCHRSHFDYMILSYLFYLHFVSPPHIAAGINMSFWPMSPIFRASGAYFIRRTFGDDELYKYVFRRYLQYMIREGYTQEFFIEGGRSRTGKIMTPKLGMLAGIVGAYASGVRRDLYLVPVSIHYGRIVEEDAYQAELGGAEKEPESFAALMRARRFLKQKYGTIYISFADPISLGDELGERKQRFVEKAGDAAVEEEKRRFIQRLGFRILRDVNKAAVAGATSISATVLLGAPKWGFRYRDFRERANALLEFTRFLGIVPTGSLARNAGNFRESISFLGTNGLIEVLQRGREEVLVVKQGRRLALDFYKNNLIHAFLVPSLLTSCLREGVAASDLAERIWWWLDLFRYEFPLPIRSELAASIERLLGYYREVGALSGDDLVDSHPLVTATLNVLQNFREAYYITALAIHGQLGPEGMTQKALMEDVRRHYKTSLLLGEVSKPEGSSDAIFRDAFSRYTEMGYIRTEQRGRAGRERWVLRGPSWDKLEEFVLGLEESLRVHTAAARR
ncbi:MAG: 1-acyl-sn-glycerol-3-phosphate acyltransferase [Deltaproteobacteria bacterium]|nr:1-acyl-sn-glycerol-3-phosphate acyltransferase [Deltaproteobacteria bacterium]